MKDTKPTITIAGLGTFLPNKPVENQHLAELFNINKDWIEVFIGSKRRYFAVDLVTQEPTHTLAEICTYAAEEAIQNSGYSIQDIEFIVMATGTPDYLMPATVNLVAEKLGINLVPTYQLQSGCSGAVQCLDVAQQFLLSGTYKVGLVIGGDICSRFADFKRDFNKMPSGELVNYVLFGDGAGAAVLTTEENKTGFTIEYVLNQLTGLNREPGQILNWFTVPPAADKELPQAVKEDYKAIEKSVPVLAKEILQSLMDELNWDLYEVDFILPPQLSGNMSKRIVEFMDVPVEKAVHCVTETGNVANALPFIQLQNLESMMYQGQRAFCITVESSKWIKGGLALSRV
ncbi:MAG: 3-oxoacyl-ACP synthase III family protein [Nostoc sp. ChiSLP01]|nr:3-oxoacyl-ACP synthase III family protein [Nostoc sp. CmiSLP01]MDZ8286542.1 3-oxoacyl-ACP synthase III family protein [Nostoc sp. ChiSLP01]